MHQLTGTAFEHLLRLELQRLNPFADPGHCVTTHAVDLAERVVRLGGRISIGTVLVPSPSGRGFTTGYSNSQSPVEDVKMHRIALQNAEDRGRDYAQNGIVTHNLLGSCWLTAKIVGSFRLGQREGFNSIYIPFEFRSIDSNGLSDISAMFAAIQPDYFRALHRCLLRPTFRCNYPIGTNQPDFVIDDMIIDVKCTARKSLDRRDVDQLLFYYALAKMYDFDTGEKSIEINRLAIYFARFAELFVIDVRTDFPPDRVTKFLDWFAQKKLGRRYVKQA